MLGKLAGKGFGVKPNEMAFDNREFFSLVRELELLKSDMEPNQQYYALRATVNGFLQIDRFFNDEDQLSLEKRADALAETVRRAFEPENPLSPADLQKAASIMIERVERVCALAEQRLNEQMA